MNVDLEERKSTLLWLREIYIIDACVEHIKYRADIFSIRCFQIIWIKKGTAEACASFVCLLCREGGGAFDMCLIQQSLIFHSKKCYTKESHSLVINYYIHIYFIVIQYQKTSE